jgi:Ca2+-binding RTX toxin-like protein
MSGSLYVIDTNFVDNVASWGGGIFANSGDIAISQVTLKGNANNAIANIAARMEVTNTTITQNTTASLDTGAGLTNQSGEVDLVFTTISDNISENSSFGGIRVTGGRVTLENSIIIGNHGTTTEADCNLFGTGQISSNGGNVFSESGDCPINMDDSSINSSDNAADVIAGAQQIANRHFVHTIAPGSPAINAVKQPSCLSVTLARDFGDDQIGLSRPRFAPLRYCDSGAIEHRPCLGKSVTIFGSQGNDVIHGTPGDDVIHGLGGNDLIFGGGGNDRICGGAGADILLGNEGFDRLRGNSGNDFLYDRTGNFNGGIDQNKCIRLQAGLATALDEC